MDDTKAGTGSRAGTGRRGRAPVSKAWLRTLGWQHYAYITPLLRKGRKFYVVRAATGEALLACGSLAAAEAVVREHGMKLASLH